MAKTGKDDEIDVDSGEIRYGSAQIYYTIQRNARKTMAITVVPDGRVLVKAPINSTATQIADRIKRRAGWILRQQDRFSRLKGHAMTPRRYVSGETHYYLGRQYRLKIEETETKFVVFRSGRIWISSPEKTDVAEIAQQVNAWYRQRAQQIILPLFTHCLARFPVNESKKKIIQGRLVKMDRRWGSCSAAGIVRLNPDLIRAPKACIEYIIWHELAHLIEPHHGKTFYALQDRLMPDWRIWEERLRNFNVN